MRFDDVVRILSSVDVAKADATDPDDKTMLFGLIDARDGGTARFNADLTTALRRWLLGAARRSLVKWGRWLHQLYRCCYLLSANGRTGSSKCPLAHWS